MERWRGSGGWVKEVGDSACRFEWSLNLHQYLGEFTCHQPGTNPHTCATSMDFSGVQNSVPSDGHGSRVQGTTGRGQA